MEVIVEIGFCLEKLAGDGVACVDEFTFLIWKIVHQHYDTQYFQYQKH